MKIIADTNVLVRAVVHDDVRQAHAAIEILKSAETIVIPTTAFCELAWVLRRYKFDRDAITGAIASLMETENVVIDRPKVEAGLKYLEAGGEFADGVIAYEGAWLGGETFVSFDRRAVTIVARQGADAQWLGTNRSMRS